MFRRKKAEPKTPHFLSLNQDIVAWSQDEKCGLKYVICTFGRPVRTLDHNDLDKKGRGVGPRPFLPSWPYTVLSLIPSHFYPSKEQYGKDAY